MIQLVSLVGAAVILLPFALSQLGRWKVESLRYQVMNVLGAAVLTGVAVIERQYGFILVEGAWTLMSVAGLIRVVRTRPVASA